jgi:hypothetical protein
VRTKPEEPILSATEGEKIMFFDSRDPMVESMDELSEALVEVQEENPECYWKPKNQEWIRVDDMTDDHLLNLYNYLHRAHEATEETDPEFYKAFFRDRSGWEYTMQSARIVYIFNKVESVLKRREIPFEKKRGFLLDHQYLFEEDN